MAHKEFEDLHGLYALDFLSREEESRLEAHFYSGCVLCQESIQEIREVLALLPYALPAAPPPVELKQKLLEKIQREEPVHLDQQKELPFEGRIQPPLQRLQPRLEGAWRRRRRILTPLFALTVVCLALLLGGYAFLLNQKLVQEQHEVSLLEDQLVRQQQEINLLKDQFVRQQQEASLLKEQLTQQQEEVMTLLNQLAERDNRIAILTAPGIKTITLTGSSKNRESRGKIFLDPTTRRALFYAYNLPSIPPDKTYQLWIIKDKPISAGIFSVDSNGNAFLEVPQLPTDAEKIKGVAVTLEPAKGLPQPSGDKYLISS